MGNRKKAIKRLASRLLDTIEAMDDAGKIPDNDVVIEGLCLALGVEIGMGQDASEEIQYHSAEITANRLIRVAASLKMERDRGV